MVVEGFVVIMKLGLVKIEMEKGFVKCLLIKFLI